MTQGLATEIDSETAQLIETDAQTRKAQYGMTLSRFITGAAAILSPALVVLWLFSQETIQLLFLAAVVVLVVVGFGLYPFFHRRNQIQLGGSIAIVTLWLVVVLSPLPLPATMPAVSVAYVTTVILGAILLGGRAALWLIAISVLGFSADIILIGTVASEWFPALDATTELVIGLVVGIFSLMTASFVVRIVVIGQEEQYRRAQSANLEVERRAATEQRQREELEAASVEIEERIQTETQQRAVLEALVEQLREAVNTIASATAEILAATTQQMASATEQNSVVTQTMTTVEEILTTVTQTAERAEEVADASRQSVVAAQHGQEAVSETITGMNLIRERVEDIAETILALSARTQQIGEIINTVNDLADQSKLLALNASIEAARAGEEGKGFAVVAMEVRQLAEQSREATARVGDILGEIQQATNTAVMVTEEGSKQAEGGITLVERAGEAIQNLTTTIELASQAVSQIAASTQQQTSGMDQLATAMNSIKQATTQTAASTQQAERSAQELGEMARQMEATVSRYKAE